MVPAEGGKPAESALLNVWITEIPLPVPEANAQSSKCCAFSCFLEGEGRGRSPKTKGSESCEPVPGPGT